LLDTDCSSSETSPFYTSELKLLDGNMRPGNIGALSIELLAPKMDQVGFEPTPSRSIGEVTLSFTTSNPFHHKTA
jgi:hypothetical protein